MPSIISKKHREGAAPWLDVARSLVTSLVLCAVTGCGAAVSPELNVLAATLRIEPSASSYAVGDTVRLRFVNSGSVETYINACASRLERLDGHTWSAVAQAPGPNCGETYHVVAPASQVLQALETPLPALVAGTYRYRIRLVGAPTSTGSPQLFYYALVSEAFTVEVSP